MCISLLWGALQLGLLGCTVGSFVETHGDGVAVGQQMEAWRHANSSFKRDCANSPGACDWDLQTKTEPASDNLRGLATHLINFVDTAVRLAF